MPWDSESAENDFIDYLAEHESGFMGGIPVRLIGMEEELGRIVHEARYGDMTLMPTPRHMSESIGRRRVTTMAKNGKKSKEAKANKKEMKKAARVQKSIDKIDKRIDKLQTKRAKLEAKRDGALTRGVKSKGKGKK